MESCNNGLSAAPDVCALHFCGLHLFYIKLVFLKGELKDKAVFCPFCLLMKRLKPMMCQSVSQHFMTPPVCGSH